MHYEIWKYMKRIFVIDWILIVVFIVSAISGVGLHIAGHGNCHEIWHNWAVFHVVGSVLFLVAIIFHVATHWGWYKGIIKKGIGRKSKEKQGYSSPVYHIFIAVRYRYRITWSKRSKLSTWAVAL